METSQSTEGIFPNRCPLVNPGKILGLLNQGLQDCLQDWHQGQVSTRLLHCVDSISIIHAAVSGLSAVAVCLWLTGSVPSHVVCLPLRNQCIWFLKKRRKKERNALSYQIGWRPLGPGFWFSFFLLLLLLWSLLALLHCLSHFNLIAVVLLGLTVLVLPLLCSLFCRMVEWRLCSLLPQSARLTLFSLYAVE